MVPDAEYAAMRALRRIVWGLSAARVEAGLSQKALAANLSVRGKTVSEWENRMSTPTLKHLIQWPRELDHWLVIVGRDGELCSGSVSWWGPGVSWEVFQRQRLAVPLRSHRLRLGMATGDLGELIGVSKHSIQRWELLHEPPRPIAHIMWAQALGYGLEIRPIDDELPRLRRLVSASPPRRPVIRRDHRVPQRR